MKVLVYSTQYMSNGGIESHLREFCAKMSEAGVQIDLIILNSIMPVETEAFLRKVCHKVYLGTHGRSYKRLFYLFYLAITVGLKKYDALYTNGQGESIKLIANIFSRRKTWVHHHHTAGDAGDQASWGTGYVEAMSKANKVIACSSRNATSMKSFLKRQVDVIPCFSRKIEVSGFSEPSATLKFGYYGRLIPEKGIETLCKLSEDPELGSIQFHIWGEGPAFPAEYFDKYQNVWYHGTYNGQEELAKVIKTIDAFLLISIHAEGLPISLLEAMSAGLPWIATNRGGIPDIACDPGSTRVLSPSPTYNETKKAVLELANDLKAGKVSRKNQIALYEKKFSSKALVSEWSEALCLS